MANTIQSNCVIERICLINHETPHTKLDFHRKASGALPMQTAMAIVLNVFCMTLFKLQIVRS